MLNLKSLNQRDLARALNIHPVYLNAILRGRARPSPDLALRIQVASGGAAMAMELLYPLKSPSRGHPPEIQRRTIMPIQ